MGDEAVVTDPHEFANKGVRLNPASFTDNDIPLNLDERSDERSVTDAAAVEVYRLDHDYVCTKLHIANSGGP
jgi:hypothetical protein